MDAATLLVGLEDGIPVPVCLEGRTLNDSSLGICLARLFLLSKDLPPFPSFLFLLVGIGCPSDAGATIVFWKVHNLLCLTD